MKAKVGIVIARRKLKQAGSRGKTVTVNLGKPKRAYPKDWVCTFQIKGLESSEVRQACGVDAIQALLNAVEGIRVALEKSDERFSWIGQEEDAGFPRLVPAFFGREFAERINRSIDQEIERFARAAKTRSKGQRRQGE